MQGESLMRPSYDASIGSTWKRCSSRHSSYLIRAIFCPYFACPSSVYVGEVGKDNDFARRLQCSLLFSFPLRYSFFARMISIVAKISFFFLVCEYNLFFVVCFIFYRESWSRRFVGIIVGRINEPLRCDS